MKVLVIIINDIEVYSLLMNLRAILNNKTFSSEVHVTIKGPQKSFSDEKSRNELLKNEHPIHINGTGMFNNNGVYIVYLKVQCEAIKGHMWRKPDYKDKYNPHITIYKGKDKHKAHKIKDFLLKEDVSLICYNYEVRVFTIKQLPLFPDIEKDFLKNESDLSKLFESGGVKKGILSRATHLVEMINK